MGSWRLCNLGSKATTIHLTVCVNFNNPTKALNLSTFMAQSALEKGQQFLQENGKKEGIKTTASGLQYKVLRDGSGKQPKATDTVEVHYEGRLIEGTVFDSSYQRRETIEFPLDGVIAGWTEGVSLMKEGAKYQFYIPSELAYGRHGAGGDSSRQKQAAG